MKAAARRALVLIGWRPGEGAVRPFRTWHSYVAVLIAAVIIGALSHWG